MAKRSISDCRRAIQIARGRDMTTLGMTVTLGGEQMFITELKTHQMSKWVSGDRRFTPRRRNFSRSRREPSLRNTPLCLPRQNRP